MEDDIIKPVLISVVGPTAVGKTSLAIKLAREFKTEIISADSRQFYKELNVGTAKPDTEELSLAKHHFIDSHTIESMYSAGEYGRDAQKLIAQLGKNNKIIIAVGGSGLYLRAIWEGFDEMPPIDPAVRKKLNIELEKSGPEGLLEELKREDSIYYAEVDKKNGQRIVRALEVIRGTGKTFSSFRQARENELDYDHIKIGLNMEREVLFERINNRMDNMIRNGLFSEAESLYAFRNHNALQTVGYSEIFNFMEEKYDKEEAIRLLKRNSRRYAKRQLTWFRKYEDIHWFKPSEYDDIIKFVEKQIKLMHK
ncbi:MAG: tRNA (adenosine(37)-N6)-dimethylallyltransferase MiaA [Cyclobacteriaceae bacterium]